jgi:hypothetical protein
MELGYVDEDANASNKRIQTKGRIRQQPLPLLYSTKMNDRQSVHKCKGMSFDLAVSEDSVGKSTNAVLPSMGGGMLMKTQERATNVFSPKDGYVNNRCLSSRSTYPDG